MKNILCFGDSNTWGYDFSTYDELIGSGKRLPFDLRWTGIVQNILGNEYRIIEDALNARTISHDDPYFPDRHGLKSFETALDAHSPIDLVVIQLGVNELKQMYNLTGGMIAYGIEKLVIAAKKSFYGYPEPKVLLVAPHPVHPDIAKMIFGFVFGNDAYSKSLELGKLYKDVAERNSCEFIDCAELSFSVNTLDGLHYSKEDHEKLGKTIANKIKEIFK